MVTKRYGSHDRRQLANEKKFIEDPQQQNASSGYTVPDHQLGFFSKQE